MFKKLLLLIIAVSPLLFTLFVGYPKAGGQSVAQRKSEEPAGVVISKRCSSVGDFREFTNCFAVSQRIAGVEFAHEVFNKTDKVSVVIKFVLLASLVIFVIAAAMILLM